MFVTGLSVLAGSGCSQGASSLQPPQTVVSTGAMRGSARASKSDVLYVPEFGATVNSYTGNPRKPAGSLNVDATGLAVDAAGRVYVSNFEGGSVGVYTRETKKLIRTIDRDLKKPTAVAVGPNGTLYVVDKRGVSIYPHAQQLRLRRIKHLDAFALATDAQSNLYVADADHNSVLEYAKGTKTLLRTITQGIVTPVAIAFDAAGNMYVANVFAPGKCGNDVNSGTVTVYAPATSTPSYTITTAQGLCNPRALAFDASGNLYVANYDNAREFAGTVTEYSVGTATLLQTFTNGIGNPDSVAIDAAGKLYVANSLTSGYGGDVTVYNPANGNLVQTISNGLRTAPNSVVIGK